MSGEGSLILTEEQLDRLADLLAMKLAATRPAAQPMLTVDDVCATFQVSRAWVYENARRLGGVKLGPGQRAPLRFDASRVAAALSPVGAEREAPPEQRASQPSRKARTRLHPVYDG